MMNKEMILDRTQKTTRRLFTSVKWVIFALLTGAVVGGIATLFHHGMAYVTQLRGQYPWLIYFLPLGGLVIAGLYRLRKIEKDLGTNAVINAIQSDKDDVPWDMAPLSQRLSRICLAVPPDVRVPHYRLAEALAVLLERSFDSIKKINIL